VAAVHGYNLTDDQAEALGQQDVAVYRRLQPSLFRLLRRAIRVLHAAQALSHNPQVSTPGAASTSLCSTCDLDDAISVYRAHCASAR
jgi:hypothetical protein